MNEAETCRQHVRPRLEAAGWDGAKQHHYTEQDSLTDGRVIASGGKAYRQEKKYSDFLLKYTRDLTLGVVEAKSIDRPAGDGMQQAKDYSEMLGLKFAYATNGREILEFDAFTGLETEIDHFPSPAELWERYQLGRKLGPGAARALLIPYQTPPKIVLRYYQKIAITRAIEAILAGQKRCLLTLATGTGKTKIAFQIAWKLWRSEWNARGEVDRKPRILFLSDRNVLIDVPMGKDFAPFGEAAHKIQGEAVKSREMYFALYQSLAKDENRPGLFREYAKDFFDLIIVDECHRGSASDESNWREILEYFEPAYQLGMTATPLRDDNRDTYLYFGNPLYIYSLKQGIDDGFLAPYRVHQITTSFDASGWRPTRGQRDKFGRVIPDAEYRTRDFERPGGVSLLARTEAIARHLTNFLKKTNRYDKTIVFCVDQEHADEMRRAIHNLNLDIVKQLPPGEQYVARVTSDEGDLGAGFLDKFTQPDEPYPVILTTSQLLTTGVDAETCRNVVLCRTISSMTEFKQIIGRGTRLHEDTNKLFFNVLDYNGSAHAKFADPDFDGELPLYSQEQIDELGNVTETTGGDDGQTGGAEGGDTGGGGTMRDTIKYKVHGGPGSIAAERTSDMDARGGNLRTVELTQYVGETVRTLCPDTEELRSRWTDADLRKAIVVELGARGIDFEELAANFGRPDADPFDLMCHVAYNAPLRTRRERAERLRLDRKDFFDEYGPDARAILNDILDKYADHGTNEFTFPDVLEVLPISRHGNVIEIANKFGGTDRLLDAVRRLQELLYAA
jgi:type I restriction enzyme, R subunit